MHFDAQLAEYIEAFAQSVRRGTPAGAFAIYAEKVRQGVKGLDDKAKRARAATCIQRISHLYHQAPAETLAVEIDRLAALVWDSPSEVVAE